MNEESIFAAALELSSDKERRAFLEQACGDDAELRRNVEELLQAQQAAGSFLKSPAPELLAAQGAASDRGPASGASGDQATCDIELPPNEEVGAEIGPYRLLERIGEGGFGVVYLARQERPVRREVALKIIKPGMDTREVIARFEAERQALALMDHENIARVLDAGTTRSGRPYFVMELVRGIPITEYCDQCNLALEERLNLFVMVCRAVQHAHAKGIIHRDIKPSNVLVGLQDGTPSPKVIDFGVAKAMNQRLTEDTLRTGFAQILGTPLYMSPEQAEMSVLDVDIRTDIYSLGVLLYVLLTGTTPFEQKRLWSASFDELRRIIREEEPPRPSNRLSTLHGDQLTTIAERRRMDVRSLRRSVQGDLDWIAMKCLEKDRTRRYETANALARDVERFLQDEPVEACPPSPGYRLRKFVRRHRGPVLAGALLLLSLIAGFCGTTWGLVESIRQRRVADDATRLAVAEQRRLDEARRQALLEKRSAEQARKQVELEKERADQNFSRARRVVDEYLREVSDSTEFLRGSPGTHELRAKLLQKARDYYEQFLEENRDSRLQVELASTSTNLGRVLEMIGEDRQAQQVLEQAVDIWEQLMEASPGAPGPRLELSTTLCELAEVSMNAGRAEESHTHVLRAVELAETLVAEDPEQKLFRHRLAENYFQAGLVYSRLSQAEPAIQMYLRTIEQFTRLDDGASEDSKFRFELASCHTNLGALYVTQGNLEQARKELDLGRSLWQALVDERPYDPSRQEGLVNALGNLGSLMYTLGDRKQAEQFLDQAIELRERLVRQNPGMPSLARDLVSSLAARSGRLAQQGKLDEALELAREARKASEQLVERFPDNVDYRCELAQCVETLAQMMQRSGRSEETVALLQEAREMYRGLSEQIPQRADLRIARATCCLNTGITLGMVGNYEQALQTFREADELLVQLRDEFPDNREYAELLATVCLNRANCLDQRGNIIEATRFQERARKLYEQLVQAHPTVLELRQNLAKTYNNESVTQLKLGDAAAGLRSAGQALGIWEKLVEEHPDVPEYGSGLVMSLTNYSGAAQANGERDEARKGLDRCIEVARSLADRFPSSPEYHRDLGRALGMRAALHMQHGEPEEATSRAREALEAFDAVKPFYPLHLSDFLDVHRLTNQVFETVGKFDEQEEQIESVIELLSSLRAGERTDSVTVRHELAQTHNRYGLLLLMRDKLPAAIEQYEAAIALWTLLMDEQPQWGTFATWRAGALVNRANALRLRGGYEEPLAGLEEAETLLREVLRQQPDEMRASRYLGNLLAVRRLTQLTRAWKLATHPDAEQRDGAAAVKLAEEAQDLGDGLEWLALDILAAAYAENGQFEQAVECATKAAGRAPFLQAFGILGRSQLYESEKPYRDPTGRRKELDLR